MPDIQGFGVGPTINPCTKGLQMWNEIIQVKIDPSDEHSPTFPCIIIDTEGLGAIDQNQDHDAKIFMLAILLSSMLVYNCQASIDEAALNNLNLILNMSNQFIENSGGFDEDHKK